MKILLVSGFLGAGKTTFIKELVKRTDLHPVILENEYGDNNLDSLELQASAKKGDELKILEFMEGCVCCTMKDSFVNSVLTIFSSLDPEYLIIEPTGVGKLSNIIDNLQPILHKTIFLLKPIVVLSPESYRQNMNEWPELYSDQIKNAGRVVFSKCEHTDPDILKNTMEEVLKINPEAEVICEHYSGMDDAWWNSLMKLEGDAVEKLPVGVNANTSSAGNVTTSSDGSGPAVNGGNEDSFSQNTLKTAGLHNVYELIQLLEDCLRGEFGHMARAKGTLWVDQEILRFDLADRMYMITGSPDDSCQCVFIGKYLDEQKLKKRLGIEKRSVLRPGR